MENTCYVTCSIGQCAELIHSAIVDGSVTGELLDRYEVQSPDGLKCLVMVYEKHYWRAGNRLTLTVTIDNMSGRTRVHTVGGGGERGCFASTGGRPSPSRAWCRMPSPPICAEAAGQANS